MMVELSNLVKKILAKHIDPNTKVPEVILLGWCSNEIASEHISRYVFASNLARGVVLDLASGSCYGSSILARGSAVQHVVSVDIDEDLLLFGKLVYNADCVQADATHLPFRERSFDTVVSIETLEHIRDQENFIHSIRSVLKEGGHLILSTPNKLYASPFLPKPLNPYHVSEYYLGQLLALLNSYGFSIVGVYGCKKVRWLELIRRILGSIIKYMLSKFSRRIHSSIDELYLIFTTKFKSYNSRELIDPDPKIYPCTELRTASNIVLFQYFIVHAVKRS